MKILLLFSGGLDSILCYKILEEKGFDFIAIQFYTPFLHINNKNKYLEFYKKNYNIDIHLIDIWNEYKKILINPVQGFGKNLNPCLDCKLLFYKKAKKIMELKGFEFIATGEVIGQRPFSQKKDTINFLEKNAGLKGKILRPLSYFHSAKIDNEIFFEIKGRGRKKQLELAEEFKINPIPTPSGGCLLTEPTYCDKLKTLYNFLENNMENFHEIYFELIKYGRVFEIEDNLIIIGRNHSDSDNFEKLFKNNNKFKLVVSKNLPAPVSALISNQNKLNKKVFEKIKEFVKKDYKEKVEFRIL
jgi:hypothetical protein